MKKSVLILVFIVLCSVGSVYGALGFPPPVPAFAEIHWPTGLLGRCPSGSGFQPCCSDGLTCGLMIDGVCIPDVDVYYEPSYTHIVQYFNDPSLNDGRCATEGPWMEDPPSCLTDIGWPTDLRGNNIECVDWGLPEVACYWTVPGKKYDFEALPAADFAPMTEDCNSMRAANNMYYGQDFDPACTCPAGPFPVCLLPNICKPSYECISSGGSCPVSGASPLVTATPATCSDGYRNNHSGIGIEQAVDDGGPCCVNGIKDGSESDIDCGGTFCAKCVDGKACTKGTECQSNQCFGGVCISCGDTICQPGAGEDSVSCPADCPPECPNAVCGPGEDACSCPQDCAKSCGDGCCTHDENATCADCPAVPGDGYCTGAEDCSSVPQDCGTCCNILAPMWTDLFIPFMENISQGLPLYALLLGNITCENTNATFKIEDGIGNNYGTYENVSFLYDSDAGLYFAAVEVDTSTLPVTSSPPDDSYYFDAFVRKQGVEPAFDVIDVGPIRIVNQCTVDDPNACVDSLLDPVTDPAMQGPPFPDDDCDGVADCVDDWVYGTEENDPIQEIEDSVTGCLGSWDCSSSPWGECKENEKGEYVATRMVRECGGGVTEKCCTFTGTGVCVPPSSEKLCLEEEEFPMFSWFNVVMVLMLLISFYFYKFRKGI